MVEGQAQVGRGMGRLCRAGLLSVGLLLSAAGIASASGDRPTANACAAWPGEPEPLPRATDADPLRARWVTLRVRELSEGALAAEREAPVRAHRLWRRVLCLDPANDAAAAGLARTPLVAVHHPPLVARVAEVPEPDPWSDLERPLGVRKPAARSRVAAAQPSQPADLSEAAEAGEAAPPPPPDPMGDAIEAVQEHLRAARFEEAIAQAERSRRELGASASPRRVAELEVLSATAALALDRRDEATESLRRALAANPMLTLDPMETPPKVRRAFDRVRAGASL